MSSVSQSTLMVLSHFQVRSPAGRSGPERHCQRRRHSVGHPRGEDHTPRALQQQHEDQRHRPHQAQAEGAVRR